MHNCNSSHGKGKEKEVACSRPPSLAWASTEMSNKLVALLDVVRLPHAWAQLPRVPVSGNAAPELDMYCTVYVVAGSGPHISALPGRSSSSPSFGYAVLAAHAAGSPPGCLSRNDVRCALMHCRPPCHYNLTSRSSCRAHQESR